MKTGFSWLFASSQIRDAPEDELVVATGLAKTGGLAT